jgi:hypothetical protein
MKKNSKELQKIKGIGEVLSKRLIEAGYDTFDKIATAGEAGLKKVNGLERLLLKPIIDQAASLAQDSKRQEAGKLKDLKAAAATVRGQVESLARTVKDRLSDRLTKKGRGKIEKQLRKMTAAIDEVEGKLESRMKSAAKGSSKAEKQPAGMTDGTTDATEVTVASKKARKTLKKINRR